MVFEQRKRVETRGTAAIAIHDIEGILWHLVMCSRIAKIGQGIQCVTAVQGVGADHVLTSGMWKLLE